MSGPRFDDVLHELRAKAPPAPDRLCQRIRELAVTDVQPAFHLRFRPALALAGAGILALGIGAALIGGLTSSPPSRSGLGAEQLQNRAVRSRELAPSLQNAPSSGSYRDTLTKAASSLPPGSRLQRYDVAMRIRVPNRDDLSTKTKQAMRETRRLGGYVVAVRYATPEDGQGDSSLVVRVPIVHVQEAIMRFSSLGSIVSQQISLQDLQPQADRLAKATRRLRARIAELRAKPSPTPAQQAELAASVRALTRLAQRSAAVVRQGTYAKVSLALTTRKAAAEHQEPGRFDRFTGDAGDILGKEAIVVLYALVVAGPFALLAVIALLAERARRRRADRRLLEETG